MIHLKFKGKYATTKDSVISFDSLKEVYHIQSFLHWQMMVDSTTYGLRSSQTSRRETVPIELLTQKKA